MVTLESLSRAPLASVLVCSVRRAALVSGDLATAPGNSYVWDWEAIILDWESQEGFLQEVVFDLALSLRDGEGVLFKSTNSFVF